MDNQIPTTHLNSRRWNKVLYHMYHGHNIASHTRVILLIAVKFYIQTESNLHEHLSLLQAYLLIIIQIEYWKFKVEKKWLGMISKSSNLLILKWGFLMISLFLSNRSESFIVSLYIYCKSIDSLDYLIFKINWKMYVKLKLTVVLLYKWNSSEIEFIFFIEAKRWIIWQELPHLFIFLQILGTSSGTAHFRRWYIKANEERALETLDFKQLSSKFTYFKHSCHYITLPWKKIA